MQLPFFYTYFPQNKVDFISSNFLMQVKAFLQPSSDQNPAKKIFKKNINQNYYLIKSWDCLRDQEIWQVYKTLQLYFKIVQHEPIKDIVPVTKSVEKVASYSLRVN